MAAFKGKHSVELKSPLCLREEGPALAIEDIVWPGFPLLRLQRLLPQSLEEAFATGSSTGRRRWSLSFVAISLVVLVGGLVYILVQMPRFLDAQRAPTFRPGVAFRLNEATYPELMLCRFRDSGFNFTVTQATFFTFQRVEYDGCVWTGTYSNCPLPPDAVYTGQTGGRNYVCTVYNRVGVKTDQVMIRSSIVFEGSVVMQASPSPATPTLLVFASRKGTTPEEALGWDDRVRPLSISAIPGASLSFTLQQSQYSYINGTALNYYSLVTDVSVPVLIKTSEAPPLVDFGSWNLLVMMASLTVVPQQEYTTFSPREYLSLIFSVFGTMSAAYSVLRVVWFRAFLWYEFTIANPSVGRGLNHLKAAARAQTDGSSHGARK